MTDKPKSISNGQASRFSDSPLSFGIRRFADCDDQSLWRFRITRYIGGDVLHEEDATPKLLMSIRDWADRALKEVQTDGSRRNAP